VADGVDDACPQGRRRGEGGAAQDVVERGQAARVGGGRAGRWRVEGLTERREPRDGRGESARVAATSREVGAHRREVGLDVAAAGAHDERERQSRQRARYIVVARPAAVAARPPRGGEGGGDAARIVAGRRATWARGARHYVALAE